MATRTTRKLRFTCRHAVALITVVCSASAVAGPPSQDPAIRDAWLDGRLETAYALNPELSTCDIRVDVAGGVVRLSGSVGSEIARDLAIAIAEAMDGVSRVEHRLGISPPVVAAGEDAAPTLLQRLDDLTASARVRANLAGNGNTRGLSIDVATRDAVVTLTGTVASRKEKMLAEMIARNTAGVHGVRDELAIRGEQSEPTKE